MVANIAGLTEPGGIAGTAGAARWLFAGFALTPLLCLLTAARIARHRMERVRGHVEEDEIAQAILERAEIAVRREARAR